MYNEQLFGLAMLIYLGSSLVYVIYLMHRDERIAKAAMWTALGGLICHTLALILRTVHSYQIGIGQPPFTNLYSSMVFFSWAIVLIYLIFEKKYGYKTLGAFIMPIAFLILASTALMSNAIEPLVPALQSNWLLVHVVTCFFGYAAFAVAFGLSLMFLIQHYYEEKNMEKVSRTIFIGLFALICGFIVFLFKNILFSAEFPMTIRKIFLIVSAGALIGGFIGVFISEIHFIKVWIRQNVIEHLLNTVCPFLPNSHVLDDLEYKAVAVGFPFLTLGIITGAAWAHYAWGSYWSWDPKETWSLITWFVYAAFLHARFTAGWRGKRTAILSILGFLFVLMTYFGVSFLLGGLHSYA